MPSKPKKVKPLTQLELWKSIRKDPTPPGRVIQPKDRQIDDEEAEREMLGEEEDQLAQLALCVFCGELREPWEFEDGLRCTWCEEERDGDHD